MENYLRDEILNTIAVLVISAILILSAIFIIGDIQANAQEPTTMTLEAGTYRFNELIYTDAPIELNNTNTYAIDFSYNGTLYHYLVFAHEFDQATEDYFYDITIMEFAETETTSMNIYNRALYNGELDDEYNGYQVPTPVDITIHSEQIVSILVGEFIIDNTDYNEVNGNNSTTIPYINVDLPTDIQIMENINMDINGFGSTTSNDNVGITALHGDRLGRLRTNNGTLISFNGIAVTSFDSWLPNSTYVYPLTDNLTATIPFTINNGLMLYVWDDTQYYQVAWYNPTDELWYVHGDYAIVVPYGHRSTNSIGTLTDGIAISLAITPNLSIDDIGYIELGGFEDTPPYDNIITVADEDAYSTFAMFCNANFISDSEKLSWGIAQHQSGQNLGQSQQLGDNILGQFLQAPIDILDSIVIYTTPNGTAITLMGVFGALLTLSLVIIFLKLFAGG